MESFKMAEQVLRQALNKVDVWGYAQESTLEEKTFNDKVTGQPYNAISGDVTIKTGEDETHVISYFAKELTKDGAVSKNFKSLKTAMDEMVTVADIAQGFTDGEPSALMCQGELTLNEYKAQDGEVRAFVKVNGKFAPSRFKGERSEFEPKAEYTIEGIVYKNIIAEMDKNDEETGRLKIEIYVPLYKGKIVPLSFVTVPTLPQNQKDYLEENFTKGASIKLWGKLVNKSKKIERVIEAGFGEDTVETTFERVREFITVGGALYEEGVHKEKFDTSLLKEAIAIRERFLASLEVKEQKPQQQQQAGFGGEAPVKTTTPPANEAKDNLEDLFGED